MRICRINNRGGPHNVVFDDDGLISMDPQDVLFEEGDTFSMRFDVPGRYEFYCYPHLGAGMNGILIVE